MVPALSWMHMPGSKARRQKKVIEPMYVLSQISDRKGLPMEFSGKGIQEHVLSRHGLDMMSP